ncbi:MAG: hypothetical protein ABIT36_12595 [Steroidobacteraceae bacterium]
MLTNPSQSISLDVDLTLRAGWALFKASFFACLPLAVLGICAGGAPQALAAATHRSYDLQWWLAYGLGSLVMLACYAAIILRQHALRIGVRASTLSCLARAVRRLPALVLNSVLAFVVMVLGLVMLVIPGLVISNYLLLAWPALLCEERGPLDALLRSWQLVSGNFWRMGKLLTIATMGLLVFVILAGVFAGVLLVVAQAGGASMIPDAQGGLSIGSVATVVLALMLAPPVLYTCAIIVAAYVSLSADGLSAPSTVPITRSARPSPS